MMSVIGLGILIVVVSFFLMLLAGMVAVLVFVTRRSRRVEEAHSARITREVEKIDAMLASGRISAAESAELRQALEDQGTPGMPSAARSRLCKTSPAILAGVCGGLAEWMNWDPTLVRVGYALATLLVAGFPGVIAYLILAIVMPPAPNAPPTRVVRALLIVLLALAAPFLLAGAALSAYLWVCAA